jgi:hypothetical protein
MPRIALQALLLLLLLVQHLAQAEDSTQSTKLCRITMISLPLKGHIAPLLGLAQELESRECVVTITANSVYQSAITTAATTTCIHADPQQLINKTM